MRKNTCLKSIVTIGAFLLITSPKFVFAESENSSGQALFKKTENTITNTQKQITNKEPLADIKDKIEQQRKEWMVRKCELLTSNIDERTTKFDENKSLHIEKYQKLKTTLQEVITRLEAKGYDVSELKADLQTLDTKIKQFATDFAAFIDSLKATKSFACGESDGDFASALEEAKAKLEVVREDATEIKDFYKTVVRPDVVALKEQKPTESSENE